MEWCTFNDFIYTTCCAGGLVLSTHWRVKAWQTKSKVPTPT